jgi:hypothetical protein
MSYLYENIMKKFIKLCLLVVMGYASSLSATGWTDLLDADLSKWEVYMGVPHPSVSLPNGLSSQELHQKKQALGLHQDPLKVFSTYLEGEETILKITGQIYAGLTTKASYENYHFKCQYKWGEQKWEPRLKRKRDSGVLFHARGRHGTFWNVWMQSLECQVQESDTGDFIPLGAVDAATYLQSQNTNKRWKFDFAGDLYHSTGYTKHYENYEKSHGEWNTLEILTLGQTSIFLVNSKPNMVIYNATYIKGGKRHPLVSGQLQIQSEGAEVYYKNIQLKNIEQFPEDLLSYIREPQSLAKNFKQERK